MRIKGFRCEAWASGRSRRTHSTADEAAGTHNDAGGTLLRIHA